MISDNKTPGIQQVIVHIRYPSVALSAFDASEEYGA